MNVTARIVDGDARYDIDPGRRGYLANAPWFAATVHLASLGVPEDEASQLLSDAEHWARRRAA